MNSALLLGLILPTNPLIQYLGRVFQKDPFRGLYRANAFDLSILIPYFTILIILSVYGLHRYALTLIYLRNQRKAPEARGRFEQIPRATVQMPSYNKRYVVEPLLQAAAPI